MIHQVSLNEIKKNVFRISLISLSLSFSPIAFAEESISFENIITKGSGCPDGSTTSVLSPDRTTLSLLFSDMVAEVPQFDGDNENDEGNDRLARHNRNMSRKVCNISVEADVLPGIQVTGVEVTSDFRGFTVMDKGTMASFTSHFLEWRGQSQQTTKVGRELANLVYNGKSVDQDWFESESFSIPIESTCDEQKKRNLQFVLKNIVTARILNSSNGNSSAFISLDSTDLSGVLRLKLKTKKCSLGAVRLSREDILRLRNNQTSGQVNPRRTPIISCPRGMVYDLRISQCRRQR